MIFDNLTDEQIKAVKTDGHMLLTACPGSGKTRVITRKIAYELGRLTHPNRRVVALTFTIRAAEEIERRLEKMNLDTAQLWSGNIHSFCLNWILRPYACFYSKTRRGFTIIDAVKPGEILEKLVSEDFPNLKNDLKNIRVRLGEHGAFLLKNDAHAPVFEAYRKVLEANRFVDFEHLLWYSLDLLRSFPKIAATLSGIFQNILIDEFQDTQELQYQIIFEIVRAGQGRTKVCFVGDCDQAIFGSLGGVAKTQAEIEAGIGMKICDCKLSGNYRSNQRVIDFYRNFQTAPLEITAVGELAKNRGRVTLSQNVHKNQLSQEIARLIQLALEEGVPKNQIAILIPAGFLFDKEVRKVKDLLPDVAFNASGISPMSNNRDNLFYKISSLFLTESSTQMYFLRNRWASEIGKELAQAIGQDPENDLFSARQVLKIVNGIQSDESNAVRYLNECLANFIQAYQIDLGVHVTLDVSFKSYFSGLEKNLARVNDEEHTIETFRNFYRQKGGITISTIHGAKGEEYMTVISFGLLHEFIPHREQIDDPNTDEKVAASKLLYVLCSRAKNNLHLIMETGRNKSVNQQLAAAQFDYDILAD